MTRLLLGAFALALLSGCAAHPTPSAVANDVALEANSLQAVAAAATKAGIAVPPAVNVALTDLQAASAAFASADTSTTVTAARVEADVNAVVAFASGLPLPPPIPTVLMAANVLLPVIEAEINPQLAGAVSPGAADQARVILRAYVVTK